MLVGNPWIYISEKALHSVPDKNNAEVYISSIAVCERHDMVAVATNDGTITIYFNDDQHLRNDASNFVTKLIEPDDYKSYCSQLCWQSSESGSNLLVAGRTDGQVIYLDTMSSRISHVQDVDEIVVLDSNKDIHQKEITSLQWNSNGNEESLRLLSVDESGCCCLWKAELNVTLVPLMKYHNDSEVNAIVFVDPLFPSVSGRFLIDSL